MKDDSFGLIRSGLASEVYLLSFIKPDKPYQHAKIIKKTQGIPDASKVYDAIDKLLENGYLEKQGSKYYPILEKLSQGLVYELENKDEHLSKNEIKLLNSLLKNLKFVDILSDELTDLIVKQPSGTHKIDALEFIANKVGTLALASVIMQEVPNKFSKYVLKDSKMSAKKLEQEVIKFEKVLSSIMEEFDKEFDTYMKKQNIVIPDYIKIRLSSIIKSMPAGIILLNKKFSRKLTVLAEAKHVVVFLDTLKSYESK